MSRTRKPLAPLDGVALERLALRYVERFATSRGRLSAYLTRKLREHGSSGEVDPAVIAERMVERGYIDDAAYAEARARSMARRGYGARRVMQALRYASIDAEEIASVTETLSAVDAALAFARRRRIGPFAAAAADRLERERQIAAFLRAGHGYPLARRIVEAVPGAEADWSDFE